jgi:hypothetical protein
VAVFSNHDPNAESKQLKRVSFLTFKEKFSDKMASMLHKNPVSWLSFLTSKEVLTAYSAKPSDVLEIRTGLSNS